MRTYKHHAYLLSYIQRLIFSIHTYTHTHTHTLICERARTHARTHTHEFSHVPKPILICSGCRSRHDMHTNTHIRARTHAHTHNHTLSLSFPTHALKDVTTFPRMDSGACRTYIQTTKMHMLAHKTLTHTHTHTHTQTYIHATHARTRTHIHTLTRT
jgi:hypothetical protein